VPYVAAQQGTTGGGSQDVPIQYSSATGTITGRIDGINNIFWIVVGVRHATVFVNGIARTENVDYTRLNNQITFVTSPQPGDVISAEAYPLYDGSTLPSVAGSGQSRISGS
jgi:hypothetical protein